MTHNHVHKKLMNVKQFARLEHIPEHAEGICDESRFYESAVRLSLLLCEQIS